MALDWNIFVIAPSMVRLLWLGDSGFSRVNVLWQELLAEAAVFSLFTSLAGAGYSLLTPLAEADVSSLSSFARTSSTGSIVVWSGGYTMVWSGPSWLKCARDPKFRSRSVGVHMAVVVVILQRSARDHYIPAFRHKCHQ